MRGSSDSLSVRLLGTLRVTVTGRPVEIPAGRQRALLATLALAAGETVAIDRLIATLWGDDPPDNPRGSTQTLVKRLRRTLGDTELVGTRPDGYVLRIDPDQVDALRFVRLLDEAARAADPAAQRARLDEALALWRGQPFAGVRSEWLERVRAPWLRERHLAGLERRIDLDLAGGRHHELVPELAELAARHPLRESLWVRLLTALARAGRPAEALARYETIRVRLAEELGTDPGPQLRRVYADLLDGTDGEKAPAAPAPVPRQLPADTAGAGFAGRGTELAALDKLLDEEGESGRLVISVITGTAGVGKTALALRWAHRVADRFPDGQLYVNLRGFDPTGQAMPPAAAVRGFLEALGVPPQQVPSTLDAQVGHYRSLLAGRRMLVVLDNAHAADQVRPLLPGSPGCLVLVTGRHELPGLVAAEGAHPLRLDLLSDAEAEQLLAHRLGHDRVAAEPDAVAEIIARCSRLPLALTIVAARAATHPRPALPSLAGELQRAGGDLDVFTAGDPATDVRPVLSWSYRRLDAGAAALFRRLGLCYGPDIATGTVASLAGRPVAEVLPLLTELTRAHLLDEHTPGRYRFHDLLHAYAVELARAHDPEPDRRAAMHRLLDHHLHSAHAAAVLLDPHQDRPAPDPPQPGVTPAHLADHDQALSWLATERRVLLAAINLAGDNGFDTHARQLARALIEYLDRRGDWHDQVTILEAALVAARRTGDEREQAPAHRDLAKPYAQLGRFDDAYAHLALALSQYGRLGEQVGVGHTYRWLGWVSRLDGHPAEALRHARQALDAYEAAGHPVGQARIRSEIGWYHALLGDHRKALHHCRQARTRLQELGDRRGEASSWRTLGYAHHHLGEHQQAVTCYRRALELSRKLGDRHGEAEILARLGDAHQASGDAAAAGTVRRYALELLTELGHPDAERVRRHLRPAA